MCIFTVWEISAQTSESILPSELVAQRLLSAGILSQYGKEYCLWMPAHRGYFFEHICTIHFSLKSVWIKSVKRDSGEEGGGR